jgi:hypothetical protein
VAKEIFYLASLIRKSGTRIRLRFLDVDILADMIRANSHQKIKNRFSLSNI